MRHHSSDITPKLRSVLFLIDGVQPTQKILERAGALRPLLESQLGELLRLGLVDTVGRATRSAAAPAKPTCVPVAEIRQSDLHASPAVRPIVGAKIQLLRQLENFDTRELAPYSASLVDARSWHDLAVRTKDLSRSLKGIAGNEEASIFWASAKKILVTWRGKDVFPGQQ